MANLAPWSLPPDHVTSFTVTPMVRNASTGALTAGASPQNIIGLLSESDFAADEASEMVMPVTVRQQNSVQTEIGNTMMLTCIRVSNSGQILSKLKQSYLYCQVAYVEGAETYSTYFRVGRWGNAIRGRGGQLVSLNLMPVGFTDGVPQSTRTATSDPF